MFVAIVKIITIFKKKKKFSLKDFENPFTS